MIEMDEAWRELKSKEVGKDEGTEAKTQTKSKEASSSKGTKDGSPAMGRTGYPVPI